MSVVKFQQIMDGERVKFTIPGEPKAKNSTKFGRNGAYTKEKIKNAHDDIRFYVQQMYRGAALDYPLGIDVTFYRPHNKTSKQKKKHWADTKPDTDNYAKLFKDALEGVLWINDSRICEEHYKKLYTDGLPRIELTVWLLKH